MAKLEALSKAFSVYPTLTISETVYHEVVTSGLAIGANDAVEVDKFCRSKRIVIFPLTEIKDVSLDMRCELHQGEIETIKIALQLSADYVFIDDVEARHVADANLQKLSAATNLKGTLGILIERYQKKLIPKSQLNEYLEEIKRRRDIWISSRLCQKLIDALKNGFL